MKKIILTTLIIFGTSLLWVKNVSASNISSTTIEDNIGLEYSNPNWCLEPDIEQYGNYAWYLLINNVWTWQNDFSNLGNPITLCYSDTEETSGAEIVDNNTLHGYYGIEGVPAEFDGHYTHFYYIDPASGETVATSSSNTIYASVYLSADDYNPDNNTYIRLKYVRQQDLQSAVSNTDLLWTTLEIHDVITDGYSSHATTTGSYGNYGTYYLKAELRKESTWWSTALSWFNPFTNSDPDIITSTTTTFVYGQMTGFDQYVASSTSFFNDFVASSTTSIEQVKESCNPISGFDLLPCISGLFIPSSGDISNAVNVFKENISTHFPLGYFSDFIDIVSTSTVGTLTIIDAELPSALGLGKPTIKLDMTHKLDSILNATTSQFSFSSSTGASSTATFYETTSYYWNIIVYILTLLYILGRLISSSVIPRKL